jgi:hypothetical protein
MRPYLESTLHKKGLILVTQSLGQVPSPSTGEGKKKTKLYLWPHPVLQLLFSTLMVQYTGQAMFLPSLF